MQKRNVIVTASIPEDVAQQMNEVLKQTGESKSKYLLRALKKQIYQDHTLVTCWEGDTHAGKGET